MATKRNALSAALQMRDDYRNTLGTVAAEQAGSIPPLRHGFGAITSTPGRIGGNYGPGTALRDGLSPYEVPMGGGRPPVVHPMLPQTGGRPAAPPPQMSALEQAFRMAGNRMNMTSEEEAALIAERGDSSPRVGIPRSGYFWSQGANMSAPGRLRYNEKVAKRKENVIQRGLARGAEREQRREMRKGMQSLMRQGLTPQQAAALSSGDSSLRNLMFGGPEYAVGMARTPYYDASARELDARAGYYNSLTGKAGASDPWGIVEDMMREGIPVPDDIMQKYWKNKFPDMFPDEDKKEDDGWGFLRPVKPRRPPLMPSIPGHSRDPFDLPSGSPGFIGM